MPTNKSGAHMAAMNEKDYYAILGVEKTATNDEIRRAFQQKARKLHPDVNKEPDSEERFKEVSEAYAVLSDEDKRRRYDAMRSGSPFGGVTGGYGSPAGTTGTGGYGDDPFGWGFPFGGAYTGRRTTTSRAYNPRVGADIVYEVTLDDDTAKRGVRRGLSFQRYAPCDACHGHGSVAHTHAVTCPTCGGTGHMTVDLASLFGFGVIDVTCPECEGTGQVVEDPCTVCGGSGRVLTASEVVIEIPAGSHDGDTVRVSGMGNAGTNGKESGDFVCRISLPSERLESGQAMGFWLLGLTTPFLALMLFAHAVVGMTIPMLLIGLYLAFRSGLGKGRGWWRNGYAHYARGLTNGLFWAVIVMLPYTCTG